MKIPLQSSSTRFLNWLDRKLSKRVKRYIFLTSLWSYLTKSDENLDMITLEKLNTVMTLGSCENSLYIPALLGKVIWKDSLGNVTREVNYHEVNVNPTSQNAIIDSALANIPSWLNYDKRDVIAADIKEMVVKMA